MGTSLPVIFVVSQSGRQANGGVESISQVLESLRQVKPIVVTQIETPVNDRWRKSGCKVQVWETRRNSLKALSMLRSNLRMFSLVRQTGCRVVHCNDISALWIAGLGARLAGAAVIFNVRNIKPEDQRYGWRWQVARRLSNRQLLLSREMHDAFVRRLNLNKRNDHSTTVDYIYSAVDRDRFHPVDAPARAQLREKFGIDIGCFAIGYVAPFDIRKAQLKFIREALPVLSQSVPAATVFFVGDFAPETNDYAKLCREAVKDLDLEESVSFAGYSAEVADWYRALDLVVVASRNEGLARCMIESLASGTPVVSFDVCSAREILEAHDCGVVVENGDYEELTTKIAALAKQDDARARFGKNGTDLAGRLFDPQVVAAEYEQMYFSLNGN